MNREKVKVAAGQITTALRAQGFTADETVALLKCLERVFNVQCFEKDLVVVGMQQLRELSQGQRTVEGILKQTGVHQ